MQKVLSAFTEVEASSLKPVKFGTSGHRGSSLNASFNAPHLLAITQAVVAYRRKAGISGPLFLGKDTHALSQPAWELVLRQLVALKVDVRLQTDLGFTATPLVSHAILQHNHNQSSRLPQADGLILTPSHNPPEDGGIKYNPPHGGAAEGEVTTWIEQEANRLLQAGELEEPAVSLEEALLHSGRYDFVGEYVRQLDEVVDTHAIRKANLKLGADPLGGAALPIWQAIAGTLELPVEVMNPVLATDFAFMPPDHDGKIRMDCSSSAVMSKLLAVKDDYDLAFGNDPDADRHGVVDAQGLLNPNHYLAVCADYLLRNRGGWPKAIQIGKTLVSSSLIDRVVEAAGHSVYEVPVGFKWFVEGLSEGWLGFAGEESAGASLLTFNGKPWSTDKDGIALCLLAAEILAVTGKTPHEYYADLTQELGAPIYKRVDVACSEALQARLLNLQPEEVELKVLGGEPVQNIMTQAPGNGASIGGVKWVTAQGWCALRPSGTETLYKIYAESFAGEAFLEAMIKDVQARLELVGAR
ncbi:phosphoglucomutase [Marinospirillum celere]|uniref:Phosphoglucomutase n=1 Tax=Marinospirillum celere TaxID=1122252 RepID=A0A1I1EET2_9GAMM|nr:alpha-D-glucose phosphate-specific phosphoglucomutase [Marinospirillum celere]SFB83838.1 phosphoglucomutase [Marinospirillum celere]